MTIFDYAVLIVIGLSVGLGWWRGFIYESLSLLGWLAAAFVARTFAADVTRYAPDLISSEVAKTALAFVVLFIATLILGGFVAWGLSKVIKFVGLGLIDGIMGGVFGLLRGVLLVLILVLLAGLTSLPQQPFWRDAWSSKPLQNMALFVKDFLPEVAAKKVNY